jgi:acetylglutamate kinase
VIKIPDFLSEQIDKADVLIEALPYLQAFRGKIFLVKVGGSAMDNMELVAGLIRDVVFLEAVGINPVIVHGGGKAISAAMKESGLEARFVGGLRVTDAASIAIVEETLSRKVNRELVQLLKDAGAKAIGVSGREVFLGERMQGKDDITGEPVDLGFVGRVVDVEPDKVLAFAAYETVPVVTPLASERDSGHALNVNADLAASALASKLKAAKLVYLSDVLGVMRDHTDSSTLIHTIRQSEIEPLIEDGTITGGMIPKLRSASDALNAGVGKVHMVDGRVPHSLLLEIFTNSGVGTEIIPDETK